MCQHLPGGHQKCQLLQGGDEGKETHTHTLSRVMSPPSQQQLGCVCTKLVCTLKECAAPTQTTPCSDSPAAFYTCKNCQTLAHDTHSLQVDLVLVIHRMENFNKWSTELVNHI